MASRSRARRPPPPLRETDVTEGGMGGGGIIALLVPLSSAMVIDGLWRFIEGGDVRSRSVYVRIGSRFVVVGGGSNFQLHLKIEANHNLNHFARMHFYYGRLCPRPPDPYTVGKLRLSAFSMCY